MVVTRNRPQYKSCTGGGQDLPIGTVFHMDGDDQLLKVLDVGVQDISECCKDCYFEHLCAKLQNEVHKVIPQCDRGKRDDGEDVYFVPVDPICQPKCSLDHDSYRT